MQKTAEKNSAVFFCGAAPYLNCLEMSRPVSRVLLKTTIYLGPSLPAGSSHLLRTAGPAICPPTVLLRIEFTASDSLQPMGELLPRLSTLTSWAQAPDRSLCRQRQSSFPSLCLHSPPDPRCGRWAPPGAPDGDEAVYLCCTCPRVTPGGRYPLSLPCGARTFLMAALSSQPRDRLSYLLHYSTGEAASCQ